MPANLSLLLESEDKIIKKINSALRNELLKVMNKAVGKVTPKIREIVKRAILDQPEVASLSNDKLKAEFGLINGRQNIENIIQVWCNNIIVSRTLPRIQNGKINASITIKAIESSYEDVLSLADAKVITEKGVELPWLEWLLKFGDRIIIRDYSIAFNPRSKSRTGLAVMVNNPRGRWRVPPEFSGTKNNNFVTRALDNIEDDIVKAIINSVETSI